LFVAGGTSDYGPPFVGAMLAYRFDSSVTPSPTVDPWCPLPNMLQNRWYPTVILLPNNDLFVAGGFDNLPVEQNNYEVFNSAASTWRTFPGHPNLWNPTVTDRALNGPLFAPIMGIFPGQFHSYPRLFVLPNYDGVFLAGPMNQSSLLPEVGATWIQMDYWRNRIEGGPPCVPMTVCGNSYPSPCFPHYPALQPTFRRDDCTAVLLPLGSGLNGVAVIGGTLKDEVAAPLICEYLEISRSMDYCTPSQEDPGPPPFGNSWAAAAPMNIQRTYTTAVLLPDGSVLAVGGVDCYPYDTNCYGQSPIPPACNGVFAPQLPCETFANGAWSLDTVCPDSPRNYHSTALLLPDGTVLTGGGEQRTSDYQIYKPAYTANPAARPTLVTPAQTVMNYATQYTATFVPPTNGDKVQKAVLMRPGSVTHSFDSDQRHVELVSNVQPGSLKFYTPTDSRAAPRGYYMLFLLTDAGIPSVASWIKLQ